MVGGESAELDRELGATEGRQLVGVQMNTPAEVVSVGEEPARLSEIENPLFTENINRLGKAGAGDLGMDFVDQTPNPCFRVLPVFEGDFMGREAGWMKVDWMKSVGVADHLEHPQLGLEVEAVT
jgi:hypothetical protein